MSKHEELQKLLTIDSLEDYSEDDALSQIWKLIEYSNALGVETGTKKAIELSKNIDPDSFFPEKRSLYHYYLSVACGDLRHRYKSQQESWEWNHPQAEQEIIHLRSAIKYFNKEKIAHPKVRLCQIYTNLANTLDFSGRFIPAIENWNNAISIDDNFGMAVANKGNAMIYHALKSLYDDGHREIYLGLGYGNFKKAIQLPIEPDALSSCKSQILYLESRHPWVKGYVPDLSKPYEVSSPIEKMYRDWCLKNVLFLNPLNDLGNYSIASHDPFALPTMIISSKIAGSYHSFFNQIKQEFIAARLFLFKGFSDSTQHYADRGVLKYDLLDSSLHSIQIENIKASFRIAYSLFDKVSYFLNYYLDLGVKENEVSFRKIWFDKKEDLRDSFKGKTNLMFRALYWVSKDLFYNEESYKAALEPDAAGIVKMRNHIEHKSFRVYEQNQLHEIAPELFSDKISYSISSDEMYIRTLKILKTAREAIIYLSLGVRWEERQKGEAKDVPTITPGIK